MARGLGILLAGALVWSAVVPNVAAADGFPRPQGATPTTTSGPAKSRAVHRCEAAGKNEITLACDYKATTAPAANASDAPRIVLNRAVLSFKPKHDSWLSLQLTFTDAGTSRASTARSVYLAIDDESGHNAVRRELPDVDFRNLAPGEPVTFSNHILMPALRPGRYTVRLWIPDPDSSLMFDPAHNFLLSSAGVADRKTGLNRLGMFAVLR